MKPDADRPTPAIDSHLDAINDLRDLLRQSYHAALRLKRDIPAEEFPTAYALTRELRTLRKTVERLRQALGEEFLDLSLDMDLSSMELDLLSSTDSSACL